MPKSLLDRLRPDSIREFRAAAKARLVEGETLVLGDRSFAAIYLWGYAAEMTLKGAYFRAIRFGERQPITWPDLRFAVKRAKDLGISGPLAAGNLHDLAGWAELLIEERRAFGAVVPMATATTLMRASQRLARLWRETLRYHANRAYSYEVEQARGYTLLIDTTCNTM